MPEDLKEGVDDDEIDVEGMGDEEGSEDDSEEDTLQKSSSYEFAGDEDEEEYADDW